MGSEDERVTGAAEIRNVEVDESLYYTKFFIYHGGRNEFHILRIQNRCCLEG